MKKLIVISLIILSLTGCYPTKTKSEIEAQLDSQLVTNNFTGCKSAVLFYNFGLSSVLAVRCPNSTTSAKYQVGKTTQTTIVVDGVEYVRK